jgi:hypothetical protein
MKNFITDLFQKSLNFNTDLEKEQVPQFNEITDDCHEQDDLASVSDDNDGSTSASDTALTPEINDVEEHVQVEPRLPSRRQNHPRRSSLSAHIKASADDAPTRRQGGICSKRRQSNTGSTTPLCSPSTEARKSSTPRPSETVNSNSNELDSGSGDRGTPSTRRSNKTHGARNRRRVYVSSKSLSKLSVSFSNLDDWNDPSGDTSSPSKLGKERHTSVSSSSDAARQPEEVQSRSQPEEVQSRSQPEDVQSRRGGSSRGPRDRLSQSSHGRSRDIRDERLSRTSHNQAPSRRRSLSQYNYANCKAPDSSDEDDTDDEFAEDKSISLAGKESSTSEEQAVPADLTRRGPSLLEHAAATREPEPASTPSLLDELLLSQSLPTNLDLQSPSEHTKRTSNLKASFTLLEDAPLLDPPSVCFDPVVQAKVAPKMKSRRPRDQLSQSSHGRSKGSRDESQSRSSHTKPPRRRRSLVQSSHGNWKAPDPSEDGMDDELAEDTLSSLEQSASSVLQEQAVPAGLTRPRSRLEHAARNRPSTPSQEKPDHLDEVPLLHELLNQSLPTNLDLQSPSEHTKYTFDLEALLNGSASSCTLLEDAPLLDPPSVCFDPVVQAKVAPKMKSRRPRDQLSQSSHGRSKGSRDESLTRPSHTKPPNRRRSLVQFRPSSMKAIDQEEKA